MKTRYKNKIFFLFTFFLLVTAPIYSQGKLEVDAPTSANLNSYFHLKYKINSTDVESFTPPRLNDFEILSGPSTMVSHDYRIVNGKSSSSSSTTYTYILSPLKSGKLIISPATVRVNGKTIRSQAVTVEINGTEKRKTPQPNQTNEEQIQPLGSKILAKDLFITVTPSRRQVYEQEAILLTYKVHSRIGVGLTNIGLSHKPDFKGLVSQEIPIKNISTDVERIGNATYKVGTIMQYLIFPQQVGTLKIPGMTFDCSVAQHDSSLDLMDAIFNGGGNIGVMVKRSSPDLEIKVEALPQPKPAGFSGGVGSFSVKGELRNSNLKTNDIATYRLIVEGRGNLKLLQPPSLNLPKDFETFEPKITEDVKVTEEGSTGRVVYDYTFVPRNVGKYEIPAVSLLFFSTKTGQYETVKTTPIQLNIEQGKKSSEDLEREMALRNSDIRPLKLEGGTLRPLKQLFWWGTPLYWFVNSLVIVVFSLIFWWAKKKIKENSDVVGLKSRKASHQAAKRMKKAKQLLLNGDDAEFYFEVHKALLGYLADKLGMETAELNKNRAEQLMKEAHIQENIVCDCLSIWDECELARYAPSVEVGKKEKMYDKVVEVISMIEQHSDKKGNAKNKSKKISFLLLSCLFVCSTVQAVTVSVEKADSAYMSGNYIEAARMYEKIAQQGVSAELYYNMGNSYYRLNELPRAILNYERARRIAPEDSDIKYNLELCQSKLTDRFEPQTEMFFITWTRLLIQSHTMDYWGNLALPSLVLFLAGLGVLLFAHKNSIRKAGFSIGGIFFILAVTFQIFASIQSDRYESEVKAVIMSDAQVYSSPSDSSKKIRTLHEGQTVIVTDDYSKGWYQIEMPDGNTGWIKNEQAEKV